MSNFVSLNGRLYCGLDILEFAKIQMFRKDIDEWEKFTVTTGKTTPNGGGQSSWYDFNYDGLTNADDKAIIETNMGKSCK